MNRTDARKFMEKAIEAMRQSVSEPRSDGKASPKVGAVLLKPDGTIETACRGELRHGDHAEFTLLERKNRSNKLDGSVLFVTLEPCAPNSRRHPKLPCAERIVLARISEVWVGLEDPDPMVDRKGIEYLKKAAIKVEMFDRDLQEIIREENRTAFAQALERAAAAAEAKTQEVTLSPLEKATPESHFDDLSKEALEEYHNVTKFKEPVDSLVFSHTLVQQGLLQQENNGFSPTGFGLLLFGKEPRRSMPQAGLLATFHDPDNREEIKNFEGPHVLVPNLAIEWLRGKLPNPIDRSEARRRDANKGFFELVREGIVNALVHRDYAIAGAKCQLIVTPDKIEIRSPGRPVEPITLEQMQSFAAPMLSRNPVLHYVFAKMGLAEERGLGMRSMKLRSQEAGLPLPTYAWQEPYLSLTFFRSSESWLRALDPKVLASLNADDRAIWQFISRKDSATMREMLDELGFDERKTQRILKKLLAGKLLRRVGKGRLTRYEAISPSPTI